MYADTFPHLDKLKYLKPRSELTGGGWFRSRALQHVANVLYRRRRWHNEEDISKDDALSNNIMCSLKPSKTGRKHLFWKIHIWFTFSHPHPRFSLGNVLHFFSLMKQAAKKANLDPGNQDEPNAVSANPRTARWIYKDERILKLNWSKQRQKPAFMHVTPVKLVKKNDTWRTQANQANQANILVSLRS